MLYVNSILSISLIFDGNVRRTGKKNKELVPMLKVKIVKINKQTKKREEKLVIK